MQDRRIHDAKPNVVHIFVNVNATCIVHADLCTQHDQTDFYDTCHKNLQYSADQS